MQYIDTIRKVISDNGVTNGLKIFFLLFSQRLLKIPESHIYSYNCPSIKKRIKLKYGSNILRGFSLIEMFGFSPYYQSKSNKLKFELNKGSNVLDIGAFIGDSAVFFAMQGAKVYAYEPQEKAYRAIKENLKLNNLKSVFAYPVPVTSDGRIVSLNSGIEEISDGFNIESYAGNNKISSVKFSDILLKEKKWDLIKIDIEGSEWELIDYVLKNPKIINNINGLVMELHYPMKNKEVQRFPLIKPLSVQESLSIHSPTYATQSRVMSILKKFIDLLEKMGFAIELEAHGNLGMLWAKKDNYVK